MGTTCQIAFEDSSTKKIISTYCHWDGDIDETGQKLLTHYNTPDLALEVSSGGYYSVLESTVTASLASAKNTEEPFIYSSVEEFFDGAEDVNYLYHDGMWHYAYSDETWHVLGAE
jgi:hypothetical protein